MFPQGGNETDLSNCTFQSCLQNTETRYFVLCVLPRSNSLFGHEACASILVPGFLALQHMNICVDRKSFQHTSHFRKIVQKPIGEDAPKLFHTQVFHKIRKRNEQNSYYNPPLVGKSRGEDTIATRFDWTNPRLSHDT